MIKINEEIYSLQTFKNKIYVGFLKDQLRRSLEGHKKRDQQGLF